MEVMRAHQVMVVVGETGSGKTTQLPKMAYECFLEKGAKESQNRRRVGCTQPRRLAAASVAKRVAEEMQSETGALVGYQVRFDDKTSAQTAIKFMTDGILLAETQADPLLRGYHTIIIDEAHERSLNIDFLLGYLKELLPRRKDLKIVISSATLDAGRFSDYFDGAPIVTVEGRTFPVEDHFLPPEKEEDIVRHVSRAVDWVTRFDSRGDVLIFLPGEREIRDCAQTLEGREYGGTKILPLFARLSLDQQQAVFRTGGQERRVVLATNVAETSVTIPGIVYVIDSGLARVSRYHPQRQIQRLQIEMISQASARQRRGRCGRVKDGVCIKLYSEEVLESAAEFTDPEIRRSSLAGVILRMKDLGLAEISEFPFLNPPSRKAITEGHQTLEEVGAIESKEGALTPLGSRLARLPLDPRLGRILLEGGERKVLEEILVIISGVSVMDVRERPAEKEQEAKQAQEMFIDRKSDFISILKLWAGLLTCQENGRWKRNHLRKYCKSRFLSYRRVLEWEQVYRELRRLVKDQCQWKTKGLSLQEQDWNHPDLIHKALLVGIPKQFGYWDPKNKVYKGTSGRQFAIFPGSGLFGNKKPEWVLAFDLVETSRLWARKVAVMNPQWLEEVAPHLCRSRYHSPYWEQQQGAVYGLETVTCGGLPIVPKRPVFYGKVNPKEAHEVFIREAILNGRFNGRSPALDKLKIVREEIHLIECKLRRPEGIWSDDAAYDFYHSRLPEEVNSAKVFHRWCEQEGHESDITISAQDIIWEDVDTSLFPDTLDFQGSAYELEYRCENEAKDDGVTVRVSIDDLEDFPEWLTTWTIAGCLEERVYLMIRSLNKAVRSLCSPARDFAEDFYDEWDGWERDGWLSVELARFLSEKTGHTVTASDFDVSRIPDELTMKIRVIGDEGEELGFGQHAETLKDQLADLIKERKETRANAQWARSGLTSWEFGEVPQQVQVGSATVFPALVNEGDSIGMQAFLTSLEAEESHRHACRKLFQIQESAHFNYVMKNFPLDPFTALSFSQRCQGGRDLMGQLGDLISEAAIGQPRSLEDFEKAQKRGKGELYDEAKRLSDLIARMSPLDQKISETISTWSTQESMKEIVQDLKEELSWLFQEDFVYRAGWERFQGYDFYLQGICERIQKIQSQPLVREEERIDQVRYYWEGWYQAWKANPSDLNLRKAGWMLSDWRLLIYAPKLPRQEKVSGKILEAKWEELGI